MLGHVTSSYFSPNLNKSIALAVVRDGKNMRGKNFLFQWKIKILVSQFRVLIFFDEENKRINA